MPGEATLTGLLEGVVAGVDADSLASIIIIFHALRSAPITRMTMLMCIYWVRDLFMYNPLLTLSGIFSGALLDWIGIGRRRLRGIVVTVVNTPLRTGKIT